MKKLLAVLLLLSASAMAQDTVRSFPPGSLDSLATGSNALSTTASYGLNLAPAIAAANWTCGAGWDCSVAGTLNKNADGLGTAQPNPAIVAVVGTTYRITVTVGAETVGFPYLIFGGTTMLTPVMSPAGTYIFSTTAATTATLAINPNTTASRFTITAVSVQALTDGTGDLTVDGNLTVNSPSRFAAGTCADPGIGLTGGGINGFSIPGQFGFSYCAAGIQHGYLSTGGFILRSTDYFGIAPTADPTGVADVRFSRAGPAAWQVGPVDAAAPINQTLQAQGVAAGTSDVAGANLTIASGNGRGSATGSSIIFQTPLAVVSGNGAQTQTTRLTIGPSTIASTFPFTAPVSSSGGYWSGSVVTGGTMTNTFATGYGGLRTYTEGFDWTNAQVAALGAALTGDITVATLPAKTQVLDAAVVITGQAAGTTTLTVSCGDAVGGTPFINYIVPSNAQAVVNTFYGDEVGERGTSIDVEHYYLPSYTATTLVTCHFISTGANLSAVTGSTGRVILTTRLLP